MYEPTTIRDFTVGSGRASCSSHPRQLLPDQLHETALFSSARSDGSYGDTS
jgi:hypothetical protein